jgi:putative NIF3 family GTP cyclohydrolase 1 type 2
VWHQAFEEQINFFALGHSATERIGPQAIGKHLQQRFDLEYQFIDLTNPF